MGIAAEERERLAALMHDIWAEWARWMIDQWDPERVRNWERQIKLHYDGLSDTEKQSDRVIADKVIEFFERLDGGRVRPTEEGPERTRTDP